MSVQISPLSRDRPPVSRQSPASEVDGSAELIRVAEHLEQAIRELGCAVTNGGTYSASAIEDLIQAVARLRGLPGTDHVISQLGQALLSAGTHDAVARLLVHVNLGRAGSTLRSCREQWEDFLL